MKPLATRVLAADVITYGVSKAVPAFAMFVGVAVFVRLVGEAAYGQYSLLAASAAAASSIGAGWINQGQLRFYSQHESDGAAFHQAVSRAQRGVALLLLIVAGAVGLLVYHRDGSLLAPLSWIAGGVFAASLTFHTVRVSTLQAQLLPRRVALLEGVRAGTFLLFPLGLIAVTGTTHLALAFGVAGSYLVGALVIQPQRTTNPGYSSLQLERVVRKLWAYGWPLSLWLACSMGFQVTDRYLIQSFFSYESTGVYASAYDLVVRSFSLLFFPITLAAHPRIMKAWNAGDYEQGMGLIRMALIAQGALYVPLVLVLLVLGPFVLDLLLGEAISDRQSTLLLPLSLAGFAWQVALLAHKPLELRNETRTMLAILVAVWVGNVTANVLLLPRFGVVIVAYAFAGAGIVYCLVCLFLGRRRMGAAGTGEPREDRGGVDVDGLSPEWAGLRSAENGDRRVGP